MTEHATDAAHQVASEAESPTCGLSIIVPVAPGDEAWHVLLGDLAMVAGPAEILLAGVGPAPAELANVVHACGGPHPISWLDTPPGRAIQMNRAARRARGRFFWFLHADTRLSPAAGAALQGALAAAPEALHYFDLAFLADGPRVMWMNAFGVRLRSRWLGMPFGDQGFCLSRELFDRLGGYDESARYGEDHLLAWKARRRGAPLRCTGETLWTSARKYRQRGWLRTTGLHVCLTCRQAFPQWCAWILGR